MWVKLVTPWRSGIECRRGVCFSSSECYGYHQWWTGGTVTIDRGHGASGGRRCRLPNKSRQL